MSTYYDYLNPPPPEEPLPEDRTPHGFLGNLFDIFSRGQYASAKFFDTFLTDSKANLFTALKNAAGEFWSPSERLDFADVIKDANPEFAKEHPNWTRALGFGANIALDPVSYVGWMGKEASLLTRLTAKGAEKFGEVLKATELAAPELKKIGALEKLAVPAEEVQKLTDKLGRIGRKGDRALQEQLFEAKEAQARLFRIEQKMGQTREAITKLPEGQRYVAKWSDRIDLASANKEEAWKVYGVKRLTQEAELANFETRLAGLQDVYDKKLGVGDYNYLIDKMAKKESPFTQASKLLSTVAGKAANAAAEVQKGVFDSTPITTLKSTLDDISKLLPRGRVPDFIKRLQNFDEFDAFRTAEQKMKDLVALNPELLKKAGLTFAGKTVLPAEALDFFGKISGLSKLKEVIKDTKAGATIAKMFNFAFELPAEYLSMRVLHNGEVSNIEGRAYTELKKHFLEMEEGPRKQIGQFASDIGDATYKRYEEYLSKGLKKNQALGLVDRDAPKIVQNFIDKALAKNELTPRQIESYSAMRRIFDEVGFELQRAGIIKSLYMNYNPRIYNNFVKDAVALVDFKKNMPNPFFQAAKQRSIKTMEEARALKLDPEMDMFMLTLNRMVEARKGLARVDFKNAIIKTFGQGKENLVPKAIAEDFKFIGEGDYASGLSEASRTLFKGYDRLTNVFRKFATTIRPAFATKQLVSNSLQSFMVLGTKAMGGMDPRILGESMQILAYKSNIIPEGSEAAARFLKSSMRTNFGERRTMAEWIKEIEDRNIIQGTDLSSVNQATRNMKKVLENEQRIRRIFTPEHAALGNFMSEAAQYMRWPSHIEDLARTTLYLNARRIGHSAEGAAKLVNKALFDYHAGLSQIERRLWRRSIPFYSFPRFAIPLIGETFLKHPGRIATIEKSTKELFLAWNKMHGGEKLNNAERSALPGYLLDQPFEAFAPDRKAIFRTLNNFNPLDTIGMIEETQDGDIDVQKTLKKVFLAQLAPIIKMPIEALVGKNFFTDQALSREENRQAGKIGNVSPSGVFSNILAMFGANAAGIPGALLGKGAGELVPDDIARVLVNAIGWEEGVDSRTNKPTVFINPYLAWAATSILPALSQAIRIDKQETPTDKFYDLFIGAGTQRLDLQQAAASKLKAKRERIQTLMQLSKQAYVDLRPDLYDDRRAELQMLMDQFIKDYSKVDWSKIRGGAK